MYPTKFLIDGIDRLGKSTLIDGIQQKLGYHLVIHYDKPKKLEYHKANLKEYQILANKYMFQLMETTTPIIFDRTHLGELVYAPLYRGYEGDYVFTYEKEMILAKPYSINTDVRLILLTSSNTDMLVDDGLSFDPTKKAEEQERFKVAFGKSNIPNKIIIDVHNGNGGYRPYADILDEALHKTHK